MFPPLAHHGYYQRLETSGLLEKAQYSLSSACAEPTSIQQLIELAQQTQTPQDPFAKATGYAPISGSLSLRQRISQFHGQQPEEDYLTFNGAQEALFCALAAMLTPGDEVLTCTPAYPTFLQTPKVFGATVKTIPMRPYLTQSHTSPLIECIQQHLSPKTKVILLNQPHNPTGWVLSQDEIQQLHALIDNTSIYLVSDEVSLHSVIKNPIPSLYTQMPNLITLGGCAKSLGLSPLRVGWAICNNTHLREKMCQVKTHLGVCTSGADEQLLEIALNNAATLMTRNNQILNENLRYFSEFTSEYAEHINWFRPMGGLLSIVELNQTYTIDAFAERTLADHKLLMLPAHTLGLEGNYFRLGLGRSDFKLALARLGNAFN